MALTLHYDFLNNPSIAGQTVGPDLSITRATKATMVDADGYIREVQSGEARFTGATFRNNLYKNSNDIGGTSWTNNNITVTTSATTTPDGNNATLIKNNSSGAASYYSRQDIVGRVAGERYIASFVAKSVAGSGWLWIIDEGLSYVFFDLISGVVGTTESEWSDAAITALGDGWYRISAVRTYTGVSSALTGIGITDADGNKTFTPTGADEQQIYAGEAQWEEAGGVARTTPSAFIATPSTTAASSLTGTSTKGLLVEEARTNICKQSEDITNASWTKDAQADVSGSNATTAPDGSTTADTLADDGSTGTGAVNIIQPIAVATSTQYCASFFVKADQTGWVALGFEGFTTPANSYIYFNAATETLGVPDAGLDDSGYESYGNGWYRLWATITTDAADTGGNFAIYLAEADDDVVITLDGSNSVFLWGMDFQAGAFPTSYIPTTTASVTRNKDQVSTSTVDWASTTVGTFYLSCSRLNSAGTLRYWLELGTSLDSVNFLENDATAMRWFIESGNVSQCAIQSPADSVPTDGALSRHAACYALNDAELYSDGTRSGTGDQTVTLPAGTFPGVFYIGQRQDGNRQPCGHIAEIRHYDERLDNGTLLLLSQGIFPTFGLSFVREITRALVRDLVSDLVK